MGQRNSRLGRGLGRIVDGPARTNPEIARTLEPELQALMGYASGGFYAPLLGEESSEIRPIEHAVRGRPT
jgi:hypothetical protein